MKLGSQKRELLRTCHWLSSQIPAGRDVPQLSGKSDLTLRPPAGRRKIFSLPGNSSANENTLYFKLSVSSNGLFVYTSSSKLSLFLRKSFLSFFLKKKKKYIYIYLFIFIFCHAIWHVEPQFPDQGLNPFPLQWKLRVLTTGSLGKSLFVCLLFVLFLITYLVVPGQLAQHCGPRGQEVLNRENNQKLGKETWFQRNLVSIPAPVLTSPESLRKQDNTCVS